MAREKHTFWGKLLIDRDSGKVTDRLSLPDHCIDVASVFRELCELPGIKRALDRLAGRRLKSVQLDRLAVFALLHDMGKGNRGFLAKENPEAKNTASHIREVAPLFFEPELSERFCAILGCDRLSHWLDPPKALYNLLVATVSHHGKPAFDEHAPDTTDFARHGKLWAASAGVDPMDAIRQLAEAARRCFPAAFAEDTEPVQITAALEHAFVGLLILADWIGSHRTAFFPFHHEGDRSRWARKRARVALSAIGLNIADQRHAIAKGLPSFEEIFRFPPRPLQDHLFRADLPSLLIAESDTGSGKTEAALAHFLSLFSEGEVDSLYFALPTRVAARELYTRVKATMESVFGMDHPQVLLAVPGYVRLDGESPDRLPSEAHLWLEPDQIQRERSWAAERPKRFLAAPVAVGTIDQVLLSALTVPHAHLRRACLNRALLVIDEVHASDIYMRAIARKVLAHHLAAGGRALLLSATLGAVARSEYLHPGSNPIPEPYEQAVAQPYPAVSSPKAPPQPLVDSSSPPRKIQIEPISAMEAPEALIPRIMEAVEAGCRVLVVLNTVNRAIGLTRLLDMSPNTAPFLFSCNGVRCPHHGRFARSDREILDEAVSQRLGKHSTSGGVLLVGTQTLEQSLDIDADWLVTDLCPMDVLLQRIGRLHRHDRGPRSVPPICTVLLPGTVDFARFLAENGQVKRGTPAGLGTVYEDMRILQRTRDLVNEAPLLQIPQDNRRLVESTTHPEFTGGLAGRKWEQHGQHLEGRSGAMLMAAHAALIPDAHFGEFTFPSGLEERISTRLGLDDRCIQLGGAFPGPFGRDIEEIILPGHMARGLSSPKLAVDRVSLAHEELTFHVESLCFTYSRFGLEKSDEPAH